LFSSGSKALAEKGKSLAQQLRATRSKLEAAIAGEIGSLKASAAPRAELGRLLVELGNAIQEDSDRGG